MPFRLRRRLRRLFRTSTQAGRHFVLTDIPGPSPDERRTVEVHLPGAYDEEVRRYPVIYMQDGQNLFDDSTSFAGSWALGEELVSASRLGADAIIVGIHHASAHRVNEYSPFVDERVGGGDAATYLRWVSDVLRPAINDRFRPRCALHLDGRAHPNRTTWSRYTPEGTITGVIAGFTNSTLPSQRTLALKSTGPETFS